MSGLVTLRTGGAASVPEGHADFRVVDSEVGSHLFVVDGSRLYDLDAATADALRAALLGEDPADVAEHLRSAFTVRPRIDGAPLDPPALRSLSLNVAQGCNLACGYCYADEGRFGGNARTMSFEVASAAVDQLLREADPGVDVVVGFMGGEPMLVAPLIHEVTAYAVEQAARTGHRVKFSLTTNATRVRPEDARLFAKHDFSVTVSIDGPPEINDVLRPDHAGRGSHAAMQAGLAHLLADPPGHLSARITVTPRSGDLLRTLQHVFDLGFDDAGFAPVLVSPDPQYAFEASEIAGFLAEIVRCGEFARDALLEGRRFPFTNFETALNEIHRGTHRPYPCGAGAAYLSVSAEGGMYACHRLVDDAGFAMGDVHTGSDVERRGSHLQARHVDRQTPCKGCWARYLCGGGCYHEVDRRGRVSCDYVRGWLEFCLASYAELSTRCPDYFVDPIAYTASTRPS